MMSLGLPEDEAITEDDLFLVWLAEEDAKEDAKEAAFLAELKGKQAWLARRPDRRAIDQIYRMKNVKDDGGRTAAGYKGRAGDCVARSISIATGLPYNEVYARLAAETGAQRASKRTPKRPASADHGINTSAQMVQGLHGRVGFRVALDDKNRVLQGPSPRR